mmetsp:Transcript_6016/g.5183  ORF Transcript_6016/g.5183 Transcript_6016/m.5183 type:complete len:91 (+) Transcript_6016:14-286(+)
MFTVSPIGRYAKTLAKVMKANTRLPTLYSSQRAYSVLFKHKANSSLFRTNTFNFSSQLDHVEHEGEDTKDIKEDENTKIKKFDFKNEDNV